MTAARFTVREGGPEGLGFLVVDGEGATVAACPSERGAERLAFLLGSWSAPASGRTVPQPERVGATLERAGASAPVTAPGPFPAPEARPVPPEAVADAVESWEGPAGCRVSVLMGGGSVRVAFPSRPRAYLRDALKAAGFRWLPEVGCWTGAAARLPAEFGPFAPGGVR